MPNHDLDRTRPGVERRTSALLGDLVLAAFDAAATECSDPGEARRLAARAVTHMLRRGRAPRARASAPAAASRAS